MKQLKTFIDESLIKSYDTNKLKKQLRNKYDILDFYDYNSDDVHRFVISVSPEMFHSITDNAGFYKTIDLYGYIITEVKHIENKNVYDIHLEPNYGIKCNDFVYKQCKGILWHITPKRNESNIDKHGIKPFEGKTYRIFNKRVFFVCGELDVIKNIKHVINQLQLNSNDYVIYKINLFRHRSKPYNVNFYHDPSNPSNKCCVYGNAVFFPHLIEDKFTNINDVLCNIDVNVIERYNHRIIIRRI